jgi:hypothetical protein
MDRLVAESSSEYPKKKEQGASPALQIVSTLFPRKMDLILIYGLALLMRAWAPPETWTTKPALPASLSSYW